MTGPGERMQWVLVGIAVLLVAVVIVTGRLFWWDWWFEHVWGIS